MPYQTKKYVSYLKQQKHAIKFMSLQRKILLHSTLSRVIAYGNRTVFCYRRCEELVDGMSRLERSFRFELIIFAIHPPVKQYWWDQACIVAMAIIDLVSVT